MMEILQVAVNKLKCNFLDVIEDNYISQNYGINSCKNYTIKTFNSIKLELIFVSNLQYVCLNDKQLLKVKSGNYKNLFTRKAHSGKIKDIELEDPIIINNITVVNNIASEHNDEWLTTEF